MRPSLLLAVLVPLAAPPARANPEAARGFKAEGDRLLQQGKTAPAAAAYEKALAARPDWLVAYDALAACYFALAQPQKVIERVRPLLELHPDHAVGWYNLAYALRKTGQYADSIVAYRRHLELRPDNTDAFYGLGKSQMALGKWDQALASLRRYVALERRPSERTWVEKARKLIAQLESEGITAPEDANAPSPADRTPADQAAALCDQGDERRKRKDLKEAARLYGEALRLDPSSTRAYDGMGEALVGAGRHAEAIPLFRKALADNPSYAAGWNYLGAALLGEGRKDEAAEAFRRATQLLPKAPDAYRELGYLLRDRGDKAGARDALHAYVELENRPEHAADKKRASSALAELQK